MGKKSLTITSTSKVSNTNNKQSIEVAATSTIQRSGNFGTSTSYVMSNVGGKKSYYQGDSITYDPTNKTTYVDGKKVGWLDNRKINANKVPEEVKAELNDPPRNRR